MAHAEGINANGSTHNGLQHAILSGISAGPETKRAQLSEPLLKRRTACLLVAREGFEPPTFGL